MRKLVLIAATVFAAMSAFAGVSVSSPAAGSTVGSPVHFVASASSSANSIASMVIYVDGNKMYTKYASSLDTYISLGTGSHYAVTKAWDNSGNVYQDSRTFYVGSTSTTTTTTSTSGTGVTIISPTSGSTTSTSVHVTASAKSSTSYPIASMIAYVDGNNAYTTYSASIDTYISVSTGSHTLTINSWDNSGKVYTNAVTFTAGSGTTTTTSSSTGSTSTSSVGMHVSSPTNGSTVGSSVTLSASATGYNPISSIAVYVDGNDTALVYSSSVNKTVSLGSGGHTAVFRAWDSTGQTYSQTVNFTVSGSTSTSTSTSSSGTTIYGIESMSGWQSCSDCASTPSGTGGTIAGYSLTQNISSPSLDGKSSKYSIWGSTPYSDVLWYKSLTSTMGSAAASAHHFIYDAYFYVDKPQYAQSIEFDINQYVNGHSLVFGTQCNLLNGHQWDYWNNQNHAWVHSGIYCGTPSAYTWHHVILEVERVSGDELHYISVTLDGNKQYYDKYVGPTSTSWSGVTVNFQLDGDYAQHAYSVWVDKFNFIYW